MEDMTTCIYSEFEETINNWMEGTLAPVDEKNHEPLTQIQGM
jgi:hypothetical protein